MTLTDSISQALTQIRNVLMRKGPTVDIPASRLIGEILEVLKRENYIDNFKLLKDTVQGSFRVYLKYDPEGNPAINNLRRVSKPGLRVYAKNNKIPRVLRGMGIAILSTSKGIMTDKEARNQKLGGEIICYVW